MGADVGTPLVLVVKSNDDLEKWAPLARLAAWGAKKVAPKLGQIGQKIGIKGGAGAGTASAVKPSTGSVATDLKPASVKVNQSMVSGAQDAAPTETSISSTTGGQEAGGGTSPADPIGDAGGESAAPWMRGGAGFDAAQRQAATTGGVKVKRDRNFDKLTESSKEPTATTSELDDVAIRDADAETPASISDAEEAAERRSTYNVPKPLQRIFGETIDRDKAQNYGAAGLVGISHMRQRGAQQNAERQAEQDRISRLAEETRAKAGTGTGGKVAVSA